jgi:hypothetical protein
MPIDPAVLNNPTCDQPDCAIGDTMPSMPDQKPTLEYGGANSQSPCGCLATTGSSKPSPHLVPAIHATGTTGSMVHHPQPSKVSARKRR